MENGDLDSEEENSDQKTTQSWIDGEKTRRVTKKLTFEHGDSIDGGSVTVSCCPSSRNCLKIHALKSDLTFPSLISGRYTIAMWRRRSEKHFGSLTRKDSQSLQENSRAKRQSQEIFSFGTKTCPLGLDKHVVLKQVDLLLFHLYTYEGLYCTYLQKLPLNLGSQIIWFLWNCPSKQFIHIARNRWYRNCVSFKKASKT